MRKLRIGIVTYKVIIFMHWKLKNVHFYTNTIFNISNYCYLFCMCLLERRVKASWCQTVRLDFGLQCVRKENGSKVELSKFLRSSHVMNSNQIKSGFRRFFQRILVLLWRNLVHSPINVIENEKKKLTSNNLCHFHHQ